MLGSVAETANVWKVIEREWYRDGEKTSMDKSSGNVEHKI